MFKLFLFCIFLFKIAKADDGYQPYPETYNHLSPNGIYQSGTTQTPIIVRESTGSNRLYHYTDGYKKPKIYSNIDLLTYVSVGNHFIYSPEITYNDGNQVTLNPATSSNMMFSIGGEFLYKLSYKFAFGVGGAYSFNPLQNSSSFGSKSTVFQAKDRSLLYGKTSLYLTEHFAVYALGGLSSFDMTIFNDITNSQLFKVRLVTPAFGLGFSLSIHERFRIFADGIYSYVSGSTMNSLIKYNGINPRIKSTSQREYHSIQGRIGIAFDFIE